MDDEYDEKWSDDFYPSDLGFEAEELGFDICDIEWYLIKKEE